jgi:hypothetical protein
LQAFPSWDMNNPLDGQSSLQSVLGFEIDSQDRMWILDQGRVDNVPGVAKLIVVCYTNIFYIHTLLVGFEKERIHQNSHFQ